MKLRQKLVAVVGWGLFMVGWGLLWMVFKQDEYTDRLLAAPGHYVCQDSQGQEGTGLEHCLCHNCSFPDWQKVSSALPSAVSPPPASHNRTRAASRGYHNYIIAPRVKCQHSNLLIVVISQATNFRDRQVIRMTWGSPGELAVAKASLVFVLADLGDRGVQDRVEEEARMYGDLLQGDFEEDYHRLASKSMCAFAWAQDSCAGVPWFMKTDDDTVHDMVALGREVGRMEEGEDSSVILCSIYPHNPVVRPGDPNNPPRYYVSDDEFPESFYPPYCLGVFYLMSGGARKRLLEAFIRRNEVMFKIDDAFVTGMLAREAEVSHRQCDLVSPGMVGINEHNIDQMVSGRIAFGHFPDHLQPNHFKLRYWIWRKLLMQHSLPKQNCIFC